jgi:ferrochelatase
MNKTGIILMNLGSPKSTKVKDVRRYLNEFLMDERVIDKPYLSRLLLVRGIITPFRSPKSAEAYQCIWQPEGSPLIIISEKLRNAVQEKTNMPVELSMRYGKPTPDEAYRRLLARVPDLKKVVLLPLYPHYAMSSYETAVEHMKASYKKNNYTFELKIIPPFYNHPFYINALAESIKPYLQNDFDQLMFSYHGVPERHIKKSDITNCHCLQKENCCDAASPAHDFCYRHQVFETTTLVMEKLNLPKEKYSLSFQSRLGKGWLEPFTDKRLEQLPNEGIKKLLVVCPAFVSDCLETLEEIEMRGKELFLHNGGESYTYIPCLNTNANWVETVMELIKENN